jgi:glycerol-3-phosphate acyltransferase PlsY
MDSAFVLAACFGGGYLLGSIPFGLILTRLAGGGDIRAIGSGNIGATNVLRTGRRGLAAATLFSDVLKGTLAVVAARYAAGIDGGAIAALGAFIGHLFPVWLNFKGGKGVATYIGILIGLGWPAALVFGVVWLGVAAATRYSSLAGLIAALSSPIYFWIIGEHTRAALFALLAAMILVSHRANIARLMAGSEPRIGAKSRDPGSAEPAASRRAENP